MKSHPFKIASPPSTGPDSPAATGEAADSRWPGAMMVGLMLLALIWPVSGLATGAVAFFSADREQGIALAVVGAAGLLLRRMFGG